MDNYNRLIEYALNLISRKRYTCLEMKKKLTLKLKRKSVEISKGEESLPIDFLVEKALQRLSELNYLNDENFCRDFVAERVKLRPRGKFLIQRELKAKGIDAEMIENTLQGVEIDEEAMARELLGRKQKTWDKFDDFKKRTKAFQFLSGKGFRPDTIYKAINSIYNTSDILEES